MPHLWIFLGFLDAWACGLLRADLNKSFTINPCRSSARLLSKCILGTVSFKLSRAGTHSLV